MQNEPQLSAEMEKRFNEKWDTLDKNGGFIHMLTLNTHNPEAIKHFLATALEEQRASIIAQLQKLEAEKWQDEEHCSCLRYAIHILNGKEV